jgi:hypothetical protein
VALSPSQAFAAAGRSAIGQWLASRQLLVDADAVLLSSSHASIACRDDWASNRIFDHALATGQRSSEMLTAARHRPVFKLRYSRHPR